jgi:AcrR family transcriptional regulator
MPAPTMTRKAEGAGQHRGRALDTQRDAALREATIELLAEIGYDRLTIDAVAARARSSKATIYRRWPGKAELVVDALHSLKGAPLLPDTGSLQGDLKCIARGSASADNLLDAQLMMGLVSALTRDAELRRVFRERLIDPHTESLRHVFEHAVARGEVAADRNLDLLVSVYPALMLRKLLMSGEMPDAHFAQQVINDVIVPLATTPGGPSPAPPHEPGRAVARRSVVRHQES